ncbi:hypothetical protein RB195_010886 [Necator americanus]|uniref:Endonuclease/exonuclease/phosphatase domain-containing protein n=1 Tax=Necator americanus TaxID=51031 RepID=A0ABR1CZW3_NECAM
MFGSNHSFRHAELPPESSKREFQKAAVSRHLRYLCVPSAALQETCMRDRPVISIEEFSSKSSRCVENNSKDDFYDELNVLMSKIASQQVVIVGIDANAKMGLEQQSNVRGKWYYPSERTSDNCDRLVDSCEQTGLIIASTLRRNHRRHQLRWQESTFLTSEERHKRKMNTIKLQLGYVLPRNIPQSDIRKSRAVWDVAFDSDSSFSQLQDMFPQKKPRSSPSTENRDGRSERRRMQDEIPPTCVCSCWSTEQKEA